MTGAAVDLTRSGAAVLAGLPLTWTVPATPPRGTVLFLPYLAGSTERVRPFLDALAAAGLLAVAFDPWQQGARTTEDPEANRDRKLAAFRREMWPVLGLSTLEAAWVLDELAARGAPEPFHAGGLSMGGDIAVALAAVDPRVRRVAAIGSTPDWTRPGMRALDRSGALVDQGEPGAAGAWLAERLSPMGQLYRYRASRPAIRFECGAEDDHIPAEAAHRFAAALPELAIAVREVEGAWHGPLFADAGAVERTLDWLAR